MLSTKHDKEVERLMNDEGLSHKEAEARVTAMEKKSKESEEDDGDESEDEASGDLEGIVLPAGLLPDVPVGKEVDVSICGLVKAVDGDMVRIKPRRFSVNVMEPMKPLESPKEVRD